MPVTPRELYDRVVVGNKGSYCFGQNGLFLGMLRGLGYRCVFSHSSPLFQPIDSFRVIPRIFPCPGRVLLPARNPTTEGELEYTHLSHLVLLVQPHPAPYDRVTYLVDVGFGGTGPVRPILLADGSSDLPQETGPEGNFAGGWVWGSYPPQRHRIVRGAFMKSSLGEFIFSLRDLLEI